MASKSCFEEHDKLVNEITNGKEKLKQLKASSCSSRSEESLLESKLVSCEEALSILQVFAPQGQGLQSGAVSSSSSPDESWGSTQVMVVRTNVPTEEFDDGYSWRKYAREHIFGPILPRTYFRCIDHVSEGCTATKQVCRSACDPNLTEITYRGKHTCRRSAPLPLEQVLGI